jgi:MFS family permease
VRLRNTSRAVVIASLGVAASMGFVGVVAPWTAAVVTCLVLSGFGAGVLQILASTVATEAVHREERGQALALTGTVRAVVMFGSPLVVALFLQAVSLAAALGIAGFLMSVPLLMQRGRRG